MLLSVKMKLFSPWTSVNAPCDNLPKSSQHTWICSVRMSSASGSSTTSAISFASALFRASLDSAACLLVLSKNDAVYELGDKLKVMSLCHDHCCVCFLVHRFGGNTSWTFCKDRVEKILYFMMSEMTLTLETLSLLTCAKSVVMSCCFVSHEG